MSAYIDFAAVKSAVSLHQVAVSMLGLKLTQKGDQFRGTCPIHNGTNPREFVCTMSRNLWYCFGGCGGGDQIALVAKKNGLKQNEAANAIAEFFGTVHSSPAGTAHRSTAPVTPPPAPAADRSPGFDPAAYVARLDPAHTSLAPLGISPDTFKAFKAGYAATGLNRGRLALPMHDTQGTILGFCGRALDGKEPMLTFPKNFVPGSVVFNWHAVRDCDFVYLCLDPVDVLKAHENGIENCVAALGSLSPDFLQVLSLWMEEKNIAAIEPM